MKQFEYVITDEVGIHARPAGALKKEAKNYSSVISVVKGDKSVAVTKTLQLMGMGIKKGDTITVTVEGDDEEKAAVDMEAFFKANF